MTSLNDQIVAYLTVNGIAFDAHDYMTGQPSDGPDQVLEWNEDKLGKFPSVEQLAAAYAKYSVDMQWPNIRSARNKLLAACDWTQLPDAPVDAAAWAAYRQELRDITTQSDPFNIQWPTPPA